MSDEANKSPSDVLKWSFCDDSMNDIKPTESKAAQELRRSAKSSYLAVYRDNINTVLAELAAARQENGRLVGGAERGAKAMGELFDRICALEIDLATQKRLHAEDMRVTNESAHFHILECKKLREELNSITFIHGPEDGTTWNDKGRKS